MTKVEEKDRAAAVCDVCEEILVVHITPDDEIETVGTPCGCGTGNGETLTVLNEDDGHLDADEE